MRKLFTAAVALTTVVVGVVASPAVAAGNPYHTNPLGFSYSSQQNVAEWYGRPTGMVITGRCNRYEPAFATARVRGAEVLAYLAAIERPDSEVCLADTQFYYGDLSRTPLWPYPTPGHRVNWPNTHLTDMRVGSAWSNHVVRYIENLMVEDKVDGVFLDVTGARLWSKLAAWDSWPQWEKDAWTRGQVDLVRRLDAARRRLNPDFIIVNNNTWDRGDALGRSGEPYVDGICLELHAITAYTRAEAGRPFSNLGHRRFLVIAKSTAEAREWINVPGVTHVSDQQNYATVTPPPVPFNPLNDRNR